MIFVFEKINTTNRRAFLQYLPGGALNRARGLRRRERSARVKDKGRGWKEVRRVGGKIRF